MKKNININTIITDISSKLINKISKEQKIFYNYFKQLLECYIEKDFDYDVNITVSFIWYIMGHVDYNDKGMYTLSRIFRYEMGYNDSIYEKFDDLLTSLLMEDIFNNSHKGVKMIKSLWRRLETGEKVLFDMSGPGIAALRREFENSIEDMRDRMIYNKYKDGKNKKNMIQKE